MNERRMTRADFQRIALDRLDDAKALLSNDRFGGAGYIVGYVVECALKAIIAKQTKAEEFPPKREVVGKYYTHDLPTLVSAAGLDTELTNEIGKDKAFAVNWRLVSVWTESVRYEDRSQSQAQELMEAIEDPEHGVLSWLRRFW